MYIRTILKVKDKCEIYIIIIIIIILTIISRIEMLKNSKGKIRINDVI